MSPADRRLRLLDANLNRASEGLRVAEDVSRLHWCLPGFAAELKELRHRLLAVGERAAGSRQALLRARDIEGDVGRDTEVEPTGVEDVDLDAVAVVDLDARPGAPISTIALGPDPKRTLVRRGEMLFHDAEICFQEWQSCASCHPDGRVDALNWDLMNDGLGNPKNVRSMVLAHRTPPSMASAVRATTEQGVRAGIRFILFSVRPEEDAVAIDEYCKSLAPVPSPYLVDGELSPAARRGKELFSDEEVNCARCHPAPLFTDRRLHDVGSRAAHDARDAFDTPTLIECWRTAPYMHDGRYVTVKELLTTGEHGHKGTGVAELTEQQLSDLIEFVLSL